MAIFRMLVCPILIFLFPLPQCLRSGIMVTEFLSFVYRNFFLKALFKVPQTFKKCCTSDWPLLSLSGAGSCLWGCLPSMPVNWGLGRMWGGGESRPDHILSPSWSSFHSQWNVYLWALQMSSSWFLVISCIRGVWLLVLKLLRLMCSWRLCLPSKQGLPFLCGTFF